MRPRLAFSLFNLVFLASSVVAFPTSSASAQSLDVAMQIIEQAVEERSIPGGSVLIMQHGEVVQQKSFGVCQIEPERPFHRDTICWIASLTKPVTAAAAMKLVEDGKLQLDAPVEKYLPVLSQLATKDGRKQTVTIRHLMSHSSGIPASVPLRPRYFFAQEWYDRSLQEVVDAIAVRPLDFAPGSQVHYSNAAPYVLGRIIEVQSGQKFDDFVRNEIFKPLQMDDTGFAVSPDKVDRAAIVYRREGKELSVYCRYDPEWNVRMTMPDGGLFSTPIDIARFANAFLQGGKGILRQASVDEMLSKQNDSYGLGWILDKQHQFSHWGSSGTLVWADQKTGVVGVFFSQIQDFNLLAKLREQFRAAADQALKESSRSGKITRYKAGMQRVAAYQSIASRIRCHWPGGNRFANCRLK